MKQLIPLLIVAISMVENILSCAHLIRPLDKFFNTCVFKSNILYVYMFSAIIRRVRAVLVLLNHTVC